MSYCIECKPRGFICYKFCDKIGCGVCLNGKTCNKDYFLFGSQTYCFECVNPNSKRAKKRLQQKKKISQTVASTPVETPIGSPLTRSRKITESQTVPNTPNGTPPGSPIKKTVSSIDIPPSDESNPKILIRKKSRSFAEWNTEFDESNTNKVSLVAKESVTVTASKDGLEFTSRKLVRHDKSTKHALGQEMSRGRRFSFGALLGIKPSGVKPRK